jgi:hypothetical protein
MWEAVLGLKCSWEEFFGVAGTMGNLRSLPLDAVDWPDIIKRSVE